MNSEQNGQQMVQQIASAFMGEVGKKEQKGKETAKTFGIGTKTNDQGLKR